MTFPITFHPTNAQASRCVISNFNVLQMDEDVGDLFSDKPMVVNRRGKNLKDMLVRSKVRNGGNTEARGTKKCNRRVCLTCDYISDEKLIVGPSGTFEVRANFTCESAGVVYCISCNKCGELYIGETGRKLKRRFTEHRNSVNKQRGRKRGG